MKTIKIVEITFFAPILAEPSCHERDAIKLAAEIAKDVDPDFADASFAHQKLITTFDQDTLPYCVEFNNKTIGECLGYERRKEHE